MEQLLNFSAEEPTLGYLYQMRYSLLLLLEASDSGNPMVTLERLDDISIQTSDSTDLYQTKYHIKNPPNLTNASPDIWKTLRVWCEGIKDERFNPDSTFFTIITTSSISEDSIAFKLKEGNFKEDDMESLIVEMDKICSESKSKTNKKGYEAFLNMPSDIKKKFLSKIRVYDSSIGIMEIKDKILSKYRLMIYDDKLIPFYERLEGWYLEQVISQFKGEIDGISFKELQKKGADIIDTFKSDHLPTDFPKPIEFSPEDLVSFTERKFVKQLKAIEVNDRTIKNAVSDFYRAYEQKSRWLRDGLINADDEIQYDDQLIDDWRESSKPKT